MKKRDGSARLNVSGSAMGPVVLSVTGTLSLETIALVSADMSSRVEDMKPSRLIIDFADVEYFDNAAALMIAVFKEKAEAGGLPVELVNLSAPALKIMSLLDVKRLSGSPSRPSEQGIHPVAGIGTMTITAAGEFKGLMVFLGEFILAFIHSLAHLREIRWSDVANNVKRVGVQGLPIVGLISFLVGLIIAFMSALQLKPLGGNIFVASLVGIAMVKELAPLMTAIIVAGRSGSAFAAEIGTMVVNEEVDALVTMGFDPMQFLVVPRVMAAFIVVPLLTLYADLFGLAGGLVVGVLGLDLTFITYINQTGSSIALSDITTGLIKSFVFAAIISGIGCYRGLRVERGAEGVGAATTSAVVSAIFFIVLADSIFAVVFHYL